MALGGDYVEWVKTADGGDLLLQVLAAEPIADVAVLGPLDEQRCLAEADAFREFVESVEPVPLFLGELEPADIDPRGEPERYTLQVWVLSHSRKWMRGTASIYQADQQTLCLESKGRIRSGASGGPVVTPAGELVGLVSHSPEQGTVISRGCERVEVHHGQAVRPSQALPVWVLNAIIAGQGP
jgi:hypothetical protein